MPIYRYKMTQPFLGRIAEQLPSAVVLGGMSPSSYVDITVDAGSKSDLDEAMSNLGFAYDSENPAASVESAAAADFDSSITIQSSGATVAKRAFLNIVGGTAVDNPGQSRVDLTLPLDVAGATKEPSGFPNRTDSVMSVVDGTRTFTIQPAATTFDYYHNGTLRTVSGAESVVWTNTDGLHFIYYNGATLTHSTTAWDLAEATQVPVAAILWDATNAKSIVIEERHGMVMDRETHRYLHSTRGTQLVSGGTVPSASYLLNGTTDADNSFAVDETVITDEDIKSTLAALADGGAIARMWREGATGVWRWDTSTVFPKVGSGATYIAKNELLTGNWVLTDIASNSYVNWWLLAVPAHTTAYRFVLVPGQTEHLTLALAQAESITSMTWGSFPFTEAVAIAQVTYRARNTYTTTGKCRIEGLVRVVTTGLATITGGSGSTNLGLGTITDTTLDILSSTGSSVTLPQATTTTAGLLSGTDKTKLDGIATGAEVNAAANVGTGQGSVYRDKTSSTLNFKTIKAGTNVTITNNADDVTISASGTGGATLSDAIPQSLGTAAAGVGTAVSRDDHVHAHGDLAGGSLHSIAVAAGAAGFMSGADKTKLDGIASGATSTPLSSTLPLAIGTASAGVGTSASRDDHVHAHGDQAGGTLHSTVVAAGAAGFMSGADKTKLDGIATGAEVNAAANVGTGEGSVYRDKTSSTLNFKTIKAGANVTITNNADDVTIAAAGGSGSPGGSTGQIQYNNASAFAGAAKATIGAEGHIIIGEETTSTPATPAAGSLLFSRYRTGRRMTGQIGPAGLDYIFQPGWFNNKIAMWIPNGNATTITGLGLTVSATGTATARNVATTNLSTSLRRLGYVSAATAGSSCGIRSGALQFWGGNAAGLGGYFAVFRFNISQVQAQSRWFVGMYGTAAVIGNVNPTTLTNIVGIGIDSTQTTIRLMYNDGAGTATTVDLGASYPATSTTAVYDFRLFVLPNTSTIYWSLQRLDVDAFTEGSLTTDIPTAATLLAPQMWHNNGTTAAAVAIDLINFYIETDN